MGCALWGLRPWAGLWINRRKNATAVRGLLEVCRWCVVRRAGAVGKERNHSRATLRRLVIWCYGILVSRAICNNAVTQMSGLFALMPASATPVNDVRKKIRISVCILMAA